MSKRFIKTVALLGGTAFLPWFGSFGIGTNSGGCFRNDAFASLFTDAGNSAIASVFDSSFFNDNKTNSDFDQFVREPISQIAQTAWTDYVFGRYAADPQFPNLIEQ